jgi:hypothetical protein
LLVNCFFLSLNERPHTRRSGKIDNNGNAKNGKGKLIDKIRTKIRNLAGFYFFALLIRIAVFHCPKFAVKLEILQNRIPVALFCHFCPKQILAPSARYLCSLSSTKGKAPSGAAYSDAAPDGACFIGYLRLQIYRAYGAGIGCDQHPIKPRCPMLKTIFSS